MKSSENFSTPLRSSEKSFGILFSIVFIIVAFYPVINSNDFHTWALITSIIFLALALLKPKALTPLNILWANFGGILGGIMAPIVIFIVFFVTVIPTGFFMKIFGRDLLNQKLDSNIKSYWIKREKELGSMKNQF